MIKVSNYGIGSAFGESSSLFTAELLNSHFHPQGFDVSKSNMFKMKIG